MDYEFSYFDAPIRPYVRENGARVFSSLRPARTVTVEQCHDMITSGALRAITERVRAAATADAMRDAKQTLLPYVTPAGVFRERRATEITALSGCFVIDVDHLATTREAEELRDAIGHDARLRPLLTFVSPSGRGVKALVGYRPYRRWDWGSRAWRPSDDLSAPTEEHLGDYARCLREAMLYIAEAYGVGDGAEGVDSACKDVSRACFFCHDPDAVAADVTTDPVKA